jgi:photosystem II stability/assembly factor-like uncharacterized protein
MLKKLLPLILIIFSFMQGIAQQWQIVAAPFSTFPTIGHSLYAKNDIVMTIAKGNQAYTSIDAGKTWTLVTLPLATETANAVVSTQKKLIVASLNKIFASTDNGKTWQLDYNLNGVDQFAVIGNTVFGATDKGIISYNETSSKWEIVALSGKDINYVFYDGKILYAAEINNNKYTLQRSADKGKTWSAVIGLDVPRAMASAGTVNYAGNIGWGIYISDDSGANWSGSIFGTPSDNVNDMITVNDTLFVSFRGATFQPSLGFYRYDAQNDAWKVKNNGLNNKNLVKLAYNGNGTLWAIQQNETGFDGAIYKIGIAKKVPGVSTEEQPLPMDGITLSPNPCRETLQLHLLHPEQAPLRAEIYDLQGKLVQKINEPYPNQIDVKPLHNGTYFLKSYFKEGFTVNKFVKE